MTAVTRRGLRHSDQEAATMTLLRSILEADLGEATAAVRNGEDVNAKGPDGLTP